MLHNIIQFIIDILQSLFARPDEVQQAPMNTPTAPELPPEAPLPPDLDTYFQPWDTKEYIRHNLRVIGDSFGMTVLQKDLLCDICKCESNFVITAKRVNSANSIDRGLFQWNTLYHAEITDSMAYDPIEATKLACKAILEKEVHIFWSASQPCWNVGGKYDSLL